MARHNSRFCNARILLNMPEIDGHGRRMRINHKIQETPPYGDHMVYDSQSCLRSVADGHAWVGIGYGKAGSRMRVEMHVSNIIKT